MSLPAAVRLGALGALLVLPVRGDAVLGPAVHVVRADLDLDRLALGPDHRGVQRLVEVELRHRDVVLEPAGDRVPSRVQRAERRVAVADRVDEHADTDEVVDVREVAAAHDHLLVDRVVVLRPARDRGLDLGLAQVGADLLPHGREVLLACGCAFRDQVHDLVVDLGVERREREVLELPLDRVHAEAVGQRRVDLERLAGLLLRRRRRDELPGAGVVQAVRELDDQHPDVARHRHDHLADGLGLRGVAVGDLVQLGHAVDEHRDLGPELAAQLVERVVGVLDRVVHERRGQRRRRHAELGQDRRDGDRVRDVRVAALAQLAAVRLLGDDVRLLDDREIGLRVVGAGGLQHRLERGERCTAARTEPTQTRPHAAGRARPAGRRGRVDAGLGRADVLGHRTPSLGRGVSLRPRGAPGRHVGHLRGR